MLPSYCHEATDAVATSTPTATVSGAALLPHHSSSLRYLSTCLVTAVVLEKSVNILIEWSIICPENLQVFTNFDWAFLIV